jgi:hypothetical protein
MTTLAQQKQTVIAFVKHFGCIQYGVYHAQYLGGYVLRCNGRYVEQEYDNVGDDLDGWSITEIPSESNVIMVWEGECENEWCGKWRQPTADELQSLTEEP